MYETRISTLEERLLAEQAERVYVAAKVPETWKERKLNEFILDSPLSWDVDGLNGVLEPGDLWNLSSQILPSSTRSDTPFWPDGKFNSYTVKSGYLLACSLRDRAEASSSTADDSLWHWIWGLEVLPKIKLFMWKCLAGAIPTAKALISRSIDVDPFCRRCGNALETVEHVLRDCPWASFVWETSPLRLQPAPASGFCSTADWFDSIRQIPHGEAHKTFANLAWAIWFSRNLLVFQNKEISHLECLATAQRASWTKVISPTVGAAKSLTMVCRREQQVKISCDASVVEGVGVGFGVVTTDKEGVVLNCCFGFMVGVFSALEGEAKAVWEDPDPSYFGDTLSNILSLAAMLRLCGFSWIPREGNAIADRLAKFASVNRSVFTSSDVLPVFGNSPSLS
ncbi:uncharacterized protein LOC131018883 [Salvia miltiorrhiza]|uniref:uncharacterized protein LOC131018883 n=1 Tax=Salvia miltiorrhiza TaxID=226208 RepID=UPI0025AD5A0B|nr:uncharacterized protein LOC131018883 [Salvia miltiorrhiza]